MGNKVRGQTDFEVGDSTYSLHFTANGMCELEAAAGCSTMAFLKRLDEAAASSDLSIGDVRLLFWAGLKEHHPEITVQQAGSLMQELGGIDKAMALAGEAVAASMPKSEEDGSAGKGKAKGAS
jgi:hypothetical protein